MTEDVKAALLKAAEVIETNGWTQGQYYDYRQAAAGTPMNECRVCAAGALCLAILGDPRIPDFNAGASGLFYQARREVSKRLPVFEALTEWNDAEGRTAEEVAAFFRRVAEAA
jgi:hypothetical protein